MFITEQFLPIKRLLLLLLVTTLVATSFHCSKKKNDQCDQVTYLPLAADINQCDFIIDGKADNIFLVINSVQELQSHGGYVVTEPLPPPQPCAALTDIDFTRYTLLIGQQFTPNIPSMLTSQTIKQDCRTGKITYTVRYSYGGFTATGLFRFGILIPKQPDGTSITLDIFGKQSFR